MKNPYAFIKSWKSIMFIGFLFLCIQIGYGQNAPTWYPSDQQSNSGTSGTSLTVNKPTNLVESDLIIVTIHLRNTSTSITNSNGFTLIRNETSGTDGNNRGTVAAFYKIATSSEPSSYTFTATGNTSNWKILSNRVTGYDASTPIGNNNGSNSGTSDVSTGTVTSINTTINNSLLVAASAIRTTVTNLAVSGGMTNAYLNQTQTAARLDYQTIATAGATGDRVWTWTTAGDYAALIFAINPTLVETDLRVVKTMSAGPYYYNNNVTFTLTASNLSISNNATGVTVNDLLPAGYTYVSHIASNGDANYIPGTGVWTIGNLNSNSSATLSITATINCYETAYSNTATISGNQYDPVSGNNTSTVNITPQTGGPIACPVIAWGDQAITYQAKQVSINVVSNDMYTTPFTLEVTSGPSNGIAQVLTGGKISYTPTGSFMGKDTLIYQLCDNSVPPQCDTAKAIITVFSSSFDVCGQAIQPRTYYLPYPENDLQVRKVFQSGNIAGGSALTVNARNIISIKVPYPNTVIFYDQWEDDYETDISTPVQSSTVIWGDNNLANGVAPGYANDIIPAGGSIVLDNTFTYSPRNQSTIVYDGKDKIYSSADLAISKVTADAGNRFPLQMLKSDVVDISKFGQSFVIGFGENTNIPSGITAFRYVSLFARASEDGTIVYLDYDGDGNNDVTSATLNEGEVFFYDGTGSTPVGDPDTYPNGDVNNPNDIKQGAIVTSNKPVGVDVAFGGVDEYGMRNFFILPGNFYGSTYYTPVGTTLSSAPVNVYFYNYNDVSITINWQNGNGGSGSVIVADNSVNYLYLSADAGYKFQSAGGQSYTAICIVDADNNGGQFDWGFNLINADGLTNFSSIAWAPGSYGTPPRAILILFGLHQ